jgi:hypothetical protein
MSDTPEYDAWCSMKQRCLNAESEGFENYGARGIQICQRWRDSFENFIADMGPRPTEAHSLERRDNGGNYDPDNCYWATSVQQNSNKRSIELHEFNGVKDTMSGWARFFCMEFHVLQRRMQKQGMTLEQAIAPQPDDHLYEYDGIKDTLSGWSRTLNIGRSTLHDRVVYQGLTIEQAIDRPKYKRNI